MREGTCLDRDEFFRKGCPFCGGKEFIEGPHGGLSVNIRCDICGAKFNDMSVFGVELLSKPTPFMQRFYQKKN